MKKLSIELATAIRGGDCADSIGTALGASAGWVIFGGPVGAFGMGLALTWAVIDCAREK